MVEVEMEKVGVVEAAKREKGEKEKIIKKR
jgi:hypothetical protein